MRLPGVSPWFWLALVLTLVLTETVALLNGRPDDTLTQTIVTYVPGWAVFAGIGWLVWHFIMSYLGRKGGEEGR